MSVELSLPLIMPSKYPTYRGCSLKRGFFLVISSTNKVTWHPYTQRPETDQQIGTHMGSDAQTI